MRSVVAAVVTLCLVLIFTTPNLPVRGIDLAVIVFWWFVVMGIYDFSALMRGWWVKSVKESVVYKEEPPPPVYKSPPPKF